MQDVFLAGEPGFGTLSTNCSLSGLDLPLQSLYLEMAQVGEQ